MNENLETHDADSIETRMSSLMMWINDDTWFPDGDSGQFTLPDGSEVISTQEVIEDEIIFLEDYDDMTCHRISEFNGVEFTKTEDIAELLSNEGNLLKFTYDFDLSSVAKSASTIDKFGSIGKHIVVKIIQFGEGNEAGCRVDIDSDIDRDWLNTWISKIQDEGWKVEA